MLLKITLTAITITVAMGFFLPVIFHPDVFIGEYAPPADPPPRDTVDAGTRYS